MRDELVSIFSLDCSQPFQTPLCYDMMLKTSPQENCISISHVSRGLKLRDEQSFLLLPFKKNNNLISEPIRNNINHLKIASGTEAT